MKTFIIPIVLTVATLTYADDTDVFTGGSTSASADVILMFDTSKSMDDKELVSNDGAYDPTKTYDNSRYRFKSNSYYLYRLDSDTLELTDNRVERIKYNEVAATQMDCSEADQPLSETGEYQGRLAYWEPYDRWRSPSKEGDRIFIDNEEQNAIVQCNVPPYTYQGQQYKYLNDFWWTRGGTPYRNSSQNSYNLDGANYFNRLWTGNYLNYKAGTQETRINITRKAAIDTIKSVDPKIRMALMRFNSNSQGAHVGVAMKAANDNQDEFENTLNGYLAEGGTPITESLHEAQLYLTEQSIKYGSASVSESKQNGEYHIPEENACSKTTKVIFFSDGKPDGDWNSDSYVENLIKNIELDDKKYLSKQCSSQGDQSNGGIEYDRGGGGCAEELAYYLLKEQDIIVDTIGGFTNAGDTAQKKLENMAEAGGGTFYPADNYEDIKDAILKAAQETILAAESSVAPTISVNRDNSLQVTDEAFYTVFQTTKTNAWQGNLKRYKLDSDGSILAEVTDVYDEDKEEYSDKDADYSIEEAIDPETKTFKDGARSFWSKRADGSDVSKGGMANRLTLERNILTNTLSSNSLNSISNEVTTEGAIPEDNSHITSNLKNDILPKSLLDISEESDQKHIELIEWVAGVKREQNENGETVLVARTEMEDSLHSRPLIINYSDNKRALFVGTNSGYLHAFDIEWGDEEKDRTAGEIFSFIPRELLTNPYLYLEPEGGRDKTYGMDGQLSYWHDDKDYDGKVDTSDGDHVYLYTGLRRGGSSYYALDVTNPENPTIKWQIHGSYQDSDKNTPAVSSGFEAMGQSWSKMVLSKMTFDGNDIVTLVFSGGYDGQNDTDENRTPDDYGNTLYIVNAETGELIIDIEADTSSIDGDMDYSFVSNPIVIDRDSNGYADLIYAADLGGQIWRFDIDENEPSKNKYITAGVIANLSNSGARDLRFFNNLDITYIDYNSSPYSIPEAETGETIDSSGFILVSLGSGNRADPLEEETQNYHFLIRDNIGKQHPTSYEATEFSELQEWGENSYDNKQGWKITLTGEGEKVVSSSVTFFGETLFTTYAPSGKEDDSNSCTGDQGASTLYTLDLYTPKDSLKTQSTGESFIPGDPIITRLPKEPDNSDSSESEYSVIVGTSEQAIITPSKTVLRNYWKENKNTEEEE